MCSFCHLAEIVTALNLWRHIFLCKANMSLITIRNNIHDPAKNCSITRDKTQLDREAEGFFFQFVSVLVVCLDSYNC